MKNKILSFKLLLVLILSYMIACRSIDQSNKNSFSPEVDRLFKKWDKENSPGCALGIIKEGKLIYKI